MQMQVLIFLYLLPSCYCWDLFQGYGIQSVGVRGKIFCNRKPTEKVAIKLYEQEILDDRWAEVGWVQPWPDGSFFIKGTFEEWSKIEPYLKVKHSCNLREGLPSSRWSKFCIYIPIKYVTTGKGPGVVEKYWEVKWDLSKTIEGQRKC
ncbi:unnamed protein product [Cylicocyclus nassatus]|uniref:AMP-activated protein kinase glycogen-binding domain-containing protein n=1 Tax=Cylicocyclus nassatus TaxID=53992 RepID=A0AA36GZF8_CYLNA|nr:unnamed protein product [Cylicocyclus nassatus]